MTFPRTGLRGVKAQVRQHLRGGYAYKCGNLIRCVSRFDVLGRSKQRCAECSFGSRPQCLRVRHGASAPNRPKTLIRISLGSTGYEFRAEIMCILSTADVYLDVTLSLKLSRILKFGGNIYISRKAFVSQCDFLLTS